MKQLPYTNAVTANGLLNAVIRVIIADYRRIHMNLVCVRGQGLKQIRNQQTYKTPPCGAVGCIAGWVLILTGRTGVNEVNFGETSGAAEILGLSYTQERELFFPDDLIHDYCLYQTPEHANAVIRHIRAFQQQYKEQLLATKLGFTNATSK